jgi:hypothetical protein
MIEMTTFRPIASALMLAALSTASIAMAEPKGLVGAFGRSAASPAPAHVAQCDCRMMKGDAATRTQCMGIMRERPSDGAKPASAG